MERGPARARRAGALPPPGVFVGGCPLALAGPVVAAGPLDRDPVDGLDALVRHGLLRQEEQDGEPHFRMYEMVREFALERLEAAAETEATRAAHVEALLGWLDGDLGPDGWGTGEGRGGSPRPIPELESERENLRLALGWCAEREEHARGLRLATRALDLWWVAGPQAEGLCWLRRFLDTAPPQVPGRLRLRALVGVAWLAYELGDPAAAAASAEVLRLAEALEDEVGMLITLRDAPLIALGRGGGDLAVARASADRLLALARRAGSICHQASALSQLGWVAAQRGDEGEAAAWFREALALPDLDWSNRQVAQLFLGYMALDAGRTDEAAPLFRAALATTWRLRREADVLEHLNAFAALSRVRGRWVRAARLLGAIDAGHERLGAVLHPEPLGWRARERTLSAARARLGASAFAAAYAAGRALALAEAVAAALDEGAAS